MLRMPSSGPTPVRLSADTLGFVSDRMYTDRSLFDVSSAPFEKEVAQELFSILKELSGEHVRFRLPYHLLTQSHTW